MRRSMRKTARARMNHLMDMALREARTDMVLAQRYAALAWRMSTRHRLRMPYSIRVLFCRKCKMFIPPTLSRTRLAGGSPRAIRISCMYCGHVYHKMLHPASFKQV